jgi:tetratricopeptide (TPR) repeat protein
MIALPLLLVLALRSDPAPVPPPAATGSAKPGPAGLGVVWAKTMPEALELARKKTDGRILVFVTDDDCGECDRQAALVTPATSFYTFMQDKVPVRVGLKTPDGKTLAERFRIAAAPVWIVLTTDGLLCGIQGGPTSQVGWFENFLQSEQAWAQYRKRLAKEQTDPTDLALVFTIAEETYKRGGDDLAESRFRRLSTSAQAGPKIRENSLAYLASIEMNQDRIAAAEKDLQALLAIATDDVLKERAELRLADVEIAKGRNDLAAARLRQFVKDHPSSELASEANELLSRLAVDAKPAGDAK